MEYLRLVGPAVLAALAVANVMVVTPGGGAPTFHVGVDWLAVAACAALTAWRGNLLIGLLGAPLLVAMARAFGFASMPA